MGDKINVTFETLFEILRKEKGTEDLQKLEPEFFEDIVLYLNEKKAILKNEQFSEAEKERARQQIESIKRMIRDLYERREKKIMIMAINKSRTGIDGTTALLNQENQFFDETLHILNKYRKEILIDILDGKYDSGKKRETEQKISRENEEKKEEAKEEIKETKAKILRFLQPVQRFMGRNMEIYGPFQPDDVASFPEHIAELLINKGVVEEIKQEN